MADNKTPRVALVTGANQGLGHALVAALADRMAPGDTVYLGARDPAKGRAAAEALGQRRARVAVAQIDVTDRRSIETLTRMLGDRHGEIELVASNAAARIVRDVPQAEQVRRFVATNNHGSRALYGALAPLLRRHARYVFVASAFGQVRNLPEPLRGRFDTDTLSLDDIEAALDGYVAAVEGGTAAEAGWPDWINIPSKIGQVATARIAARDMARDRPDDGILINAACPGLVDTEASRPWFDDMSSAQSPEDAAAPIADLLLNPSGVTAPTGQLVQFGRTMPWL